MRAAPDWLWPIVPLTALFAPLSLLAYFVFRIYCLLVSGIEAHYQLGLAWFFIAIEFITIIPTVLTYTTRVLVVRRPRRPRLFVAHDSLPAVDVLITSTTAKSRSTVLDTVRAACASDYPRDLLTVYLLDDSHSIRLRYAIARLSQAYPNLIYASHEPGEVDGGAAKSVTLNHGIQISADMAREAGDTPAPFLAVLDADMIVEAGWLRRMIPHFLSDCHLGMACPPLYHSNIAPKDPLHQDLAYLFATTELIHDGLGAADCLGSGFVVRRAALSSTGGFPTYSIAGDTACSGALMGAGWRVAFLDERLQIGRVPETLRGHVRQRVLWTIGNVQTALHQRFRLFGGEVRRCSRRQRLAGFVLGMSSFANASIGIVGFLGMPLILLSGYPLVVYASTFQLKWLLRLVCIWLFADYVSRLAMAAFVGYREAMRWDQADAWLTPYFTLAFLRVFILPGWLGGTSAVALARPADGEEEPAARDSELRFPQRIRRIYIPLWLPLPTLYVYGCALGAVLTLLRALFPDLGLYSAYGFIPPLGGREKWIFLLVRTGWPPLFWVQSCASCCLPLSWVVRPSPAGDARRVPLTTTARKNCSSTVASSAPWNGEGGVDDQSPKSSLESGVFAPGVGEGRLATQAGSRMVFGCSGWGGFMIVAWSIACFCWSWEVAG